MIGVLYGYSNLVQYGPDHPMQEGRDYVILDHSRLKRTRNSQGIMIGSARTNPGKLVTCKADLADAEKTAQLKTVYDALCSLGVDALVSIGGDDTLKTANKFQLFQDCLPAGSKKIPVVHVPKTIDNDYMGIDFTFGYFTAVETLAGEIRNLLADAESTRSYFLAETMGRSAGWIAYGAAIAGEASLVISVEDITGKYRQEEEVVNPKTGEKTTRAVMNIDETVKRIVATMRVREDAERKEYGVIVVAEGLAEYLPMSYLKDVPRDEHGHISISHINLCELFSNLISKEYTRQTGKKRRVKGLQLGYESRCARPQAFDVMLGSQLGVGRLPGAGGRTTQRRHGVGVRPTGPALCAVQHVGGSRDARDDRPLRQARFRFPPTGTVPRNVHPRMNSTGRPPTTVPRAHAHESRRWRLVPRSHGPLAIRCVLCARCAPCDPGRSGLRGGELAGERRERLHVVGSLEGARIRAVPAAQAALHLSHRRVLVLGEPAFDFLEQLAEIRRPVAEQGGGHLHDIGPGQQGLDHVVGKVDASRGRQGHIGLITDDGDPPQGQPQFVPAAEHQVGRHLQRLQVDVRFEEPVEQHQAVGAGLRRRGGPGRASR